MNEPDELLHIAMPDDWTAARAAGEYRMSTRDKTLDEVGFVHCSYPGQIEAVANRYYSDVAELVLTRAARAFEAGADGVIASPQEAAAIRALPEAAGKRIITPGVRPAGAALGDQKRVATPARAIADGADHIVVGRPIWQASDPAAAARAILEELP